MQLNDGILTISNAYNKEFIRLLSYYDIQIGDIEPQWGTGNKSYSYYACKGFPDQINLYRFQRLAKGGLYKGATFLECVDSTQTLHMPFKYHLYNPWDVPEYIEDDYEDCVRQVVENYTSTSDHITILWSGGVDSSLILSGFIKYGDSKKFSIGYTDESIREYPVFYEYLKQNKYELISLSDMNISDMPGLVVHGVGGGVICDTAPTYSSRDMFSMPWHNAIDKNEWGSDYNSLYEFCEQYLVNYGKQHATVADLCSFANMATKTNNTMMYLHYDYNLKSNKLSSFYDNNVFRQWNYFHAEKYMIGSHETCNYKLPAKKLIFAITHDPIYLETKGKGFSQDLWKKKCRISGNDTPHDYFFIDHTEEKISANSKEEYLEKYQGKFDSYFYKPISAVTSSNV